MRETISTTTTIDSTTVTVSTSRDMFVGMSIYGVSVAVCTKITGITNDTTIEISPAAIATGVANHIYTDLLPNQYLELCQSKKDVENICDEQGRYVQIIVRNEDNVTRSNYRSIQKRAQADNFWIKVFPLEYSPSILSLEKAGLREEAEVSMWTPVRTWDTNGYDWNDIDPIRFTVKIDKELYVIKDRSKRGSVHNDFLYYTLGLFKK